ncbi:MAG: glycosyltransferase family 4 protein [Saprospiraceae bacterium]|nr:glycosyltransferase family 4 protein [Saprospiraceae bacterium]
MKIAILSSVAWRTPPLKYGPWEQVASNVAEGLVALGVDVTVFATANSATDGKLAAVVESGYAETPGADGKVLECLHISHLMERAGEFDLIHNHFDFLPLTYSRVIKPPMLTTIHGFSSEAIVPVYRRYNDTSHYISISHSDRHPALRYLATVYNGVDTTQFSLQEKPGAYLLYFGRIHPHKGTWDAIQIARQSKRQLVIAGLVQDEQYFKEKIAPLVDGEAVKYVGNVGPEERDALLGNAAAMLHPINFEEPFGLSVVESMLCGTPVIAYKKGAMPELIKHGETGFLVGNMEEATAAVGEIGGINRLDCHHHAFKNFSRQRMAADYWQAYQRILS